MDNKSHAILITYTHIKSENYHTFNKWLENLNKTIKNFPGFLSQTILKPNSIHQTDWQIIQNFDSIESAKSWLQSKERKALVNELVPILVGVDNIYLTQTDAAHQAVTAEISTKVLPQNEKQFIEWQSRIAPKQSKFPGFIGYKLLKPKANENIWTAIITFDSDENLENWLNSKERQEILDDLNKISSQTHIQKVHSGFDFWFKDTKDERVIWKENMLVLLTLYPVVFLFSFFEKRFMHFVPFWLSLFIANAFSTIVLSYVTVPILMRSFNWWLHIKKENYTKYNILGFLFVISLYSILLFIAYLMTRQ